MAYLQPQLFCGSTLSSTAACAPLQVTPGDIYVHHPGLTADTEQESAEIAVENGAAVIVAGHVVLGPDVPDTGFDPTKAFVPDEVPLVRVDDPLGAGSRLAAAFYGECAVWPYAANAMCCWLD
jgi:hypothetical protein